MSKQKIWPLSLWPALFALLGLMLALWLALGLHGLFSVAGRARAAAAQLKGLAADDDLILVAASMGRGAADRGRILFPFRPAAALADDADALDLDSLPFRRLLVQQGVDLKKWRLDPAGLQPLPGAPGWLVKKLRDPNLLLVRLWDPKGVSLLPPLDPSALASPVVAAVSGAVSGTEPHRSVAAAAQACTRPSPLGGVSCGPEPWFRVGPSVQRINGLARLCLWAHPPKDRARLVITLRDMSGYKGYNYLNLQANFVDSVRRDARRFPVFLRVKGLNTTQNMRCTKQQGRCSLRVDLRHKKQNRPLQIEIWTEDNGRQLFCLTGSLSAADDEEPVHD